MPHAAQANRDRPQRAVMHLVGQGHPHELAALDKALGDGEAATVKETLRFLDGAALAHLAAHGHHEPDNVLFSHLDLADGPLMAYDLLALDAAPQQVVLSACDVGQASVRAGNEALGFTAALLHAGTRTVVSAVANVPDDVAVDVMAGYHRALAAGTAPPAALAGALRRAPLVPFVCFGAGR